MFPTHGLVNTKEITANKCCLSRRTALKTIATGIGGAALPNLAFAESVVPRPTSNQPTVSNNIPRIHNKVNEYVEAWRKRAHIPGLAIGVMKHGEPILAKGYGMADLEHDIPVTENTLFQLASVTKQFTATGIMMLVEEGRIELDERASKYLPGLPSG